MQKEPDVTKKNELLTKLGQSLVTGNLTDQELLTHTDDNSLIQILPDANVIKIGGQSFIDRGRAAVALRRPPPTDHDACWYGRRARARVALRPRRGCPSGAPLAAHDQSHRRGDATRFGPSRGKRHGGAVVLRAHAPARLDRA